ncbi:MAG TPA: cyclic nucleotide-binding domain-containing protein [Trebonia sp.]|nr:cyclic nucleotide-binding domain-containing protein [Trebonia sp.]
MVNFWDSLTLAERQAFTAVARERTFAGGATLMQEGEQANYVMVIRAGWTQIAVKENGGVRVIAERGPGQLVGERGALRVNVRSATVIALETIHALVMRTEDFASFISAHPRVLEVVESQIYDRLTEDPTGYEPGDWPGMALAEQPGHAPLQSPSHLLTGENCTVLRTDVVAFGALNRNDRDRRIIRLASLQMMQVSLGHLWDSCISEDRGDGLLIIVPPMIPTTRIMERLDWELPRELRLHNRTYSESVRIKLRVAANVGPVMGDPLGVSGEAIIRTARLIDAPVFKEAMASAGASLGIIVSAFIYDTVIRHAAGLMDVDEYEEVEANVKESSMPAWMRLVLTDAPEEPG